MNHRLKGRSSTSATAQMGLPQGSHELSSPARVSKVLGALLKVLCCHTSSSNLYIRFWLILQNYMWGCRVLFKSFNVSLV